MAEEVRVDNRDSAPSSSQHRSPHALQTIDEAAEVDFIYEDAYNEDEALKRFINDRPGGFLVIGKPGSGRSTLARNLALRTGSELVDIPTSVEGAITAGTPAGLKARELLFAGHAIPTELVLEVLEERIESPDVAYRGYVLDGLFDCSADLPAQIEFVRGLKRRPDVIINVDIGDRDLERRRVSQLVDPHTNAVYVNDQYNPRVAIVQPPKQTVVGLGIDEVLDGAEENDGQSEASAELVTGDASLETPPADVIARLVKRREDTIGMVRDALQAYEANAPAIAQLLAEHDELRVVHVDGTQPIDANVRLLLEKIALMDLTPVVEPIRLHLPIDVGEDLSEDVLSRLVIVDTDDAWPWLPSPFGRFCPVEYMRENRALVSGKAGFAVGYLGMLFLMASEENVELFMKNPRMYLMQRPTINCRLWLLGGPMSGKMTLAKGLADTYGAKVITLASAIEGLIADESHPEREQIKTAAAALRAGSTFPTELNVMALKHAVEEATGGDPSAGFILVGYPTNSDQAHELFDSGIPLPDGVVVLIDMSAEAASHTRAMSAFIDPTTGHAVYAGTDRQGAYLTWPRYSSSLYDAWNEVFQENINDVLDAIKVVALPVYEVNLDSPADVVLRNTVKAVNPFHPRAINKHPSLLEVEEGIIPYGDSKYYCPVLLRDLRILKRGGEEYSVQFLDRTYHLSSEDAMEAFILKPDEYLPLVKAPSIPPLRIVILGPRGSGKTTHGQRLGEELGITWVPFHEKFPETRAAEEGEPPHVTAALMDFWHGKEHAAKGIVLEGFPKSTEEVTLMGDRNIIPDAVVILRLQAETAIRRLYKSTYEQELVNRERRKKKIAAAKAEAERAGEEFEMEQEDADDEETGPALENKLKELITEHNDNDMALLDEIRASFEELQVPVIEVNASRDKRIVWSALRKAIAAYVEHRASLFETVNILEPEIAEGLVRSGHVLPSKFNRWCPVEVAEGRAIVPLDRTAPTIAAKYRRHIYFFASTANREKFATDPRKYASLAPPPPATPVRFAVVGPPKSGKTTLARRFATDLRLTRLSAGEAIRLVLDKHRDTQLGLAMDAQLRSGRELSDEMVVTAIELAIGTANSTGYVLDGFPSSQSQVELLEKKGILPSVIIELELADESILARGAADRAQSSRANHLHDSDRILRVRAEAYRASIGQVRAWYETRHNNWKALSGEKSKWWLVTETQRILRANIHHRQIFFAKQRKGHAASIADMGVAPTEFAAHIGAFGHFCPVSLVDRGELIDCLGRDFKYAAVYRGLYYKMNGPEELDRFLHHPSHYVAHTLPAQLPVKRSALDVKMMFPKQLELKGYCPVTFYEGGLRYESIVPGSLDFVAEYDGRLYAMATDEELERFMRTPAKYANLELPKKLPPVRSPLAIASLPILGYMEQTVASSITRALTDLGRLKPKYPFLTAQESALRYIGVHLKAYNPRLTDFTRKRFRKLLTHFEDSCALIPYLRQSMRDTYMKPAERPIDFDYKMDRFLRLRDRSVLAALVAGVSTHGRASVGSAAGIAPQPPSESRPASAGRRPRPMSGRRIDVVPAEA